jgi:hypothetical protein
MRPDRKPNVHEEVGGRDLDLDARAAVVDATVVRGLVSTANPAGKLLQGSDRNFNQGGWICHEADPLSTNARRNSSASNGSATRQNARICAKKLEGKKFQPTKWKNSAEMRRSKRRRSMWALIIKSDPKNPIEGK